MTSLTVSVDCQGYINIAARAPKLGTDTLQSPNKSGETIANLAQSSSEKHCDSFNEHYPAPHTFLRRKVLGIQYFSLSYMRDIILSQNVPAGRSLPIVAGW